MNSDVQPADIGLPTGNGKELSNSQACCLAKHEPGCCLVSFHFLWAILCPQAVRCLAFVCFPPSTDLGRRLRGRWVFMRRPPSRWPMSFSPGYENSLGVKEHTQDFDFLNILGDPYQIWKDVFHLVLAPLQDAWLFPTLGHLPLPLRWILEQVHDLLQPHGSCCRRNSLV